MIPVPTRRLAILVGALALVLFVALGLDDGSAGAVMVVGNLVILVACALDVALAPSPAAFTVERAHPSAVSIGSQASLTWTVSRRGGRTATVDVADELYPSLQAGTRRFSVEVPADGQADATTWIEPTRRGRFEISSLTLRTYGPLGLLMRQKTIEQTTRLRVLPRFRSAKDAQLALQQARISQSGLRRSRNRGSGTEFDHLREMTPDDETRRIDWAATARSMRPVVRTFRIEENQTVICLLDSGRTMAGRINGVPRIEYGMDAAMVLAELATGLGDKMGLVAFDRDLHTSIDASNRRSQRTMVSERLFDLEPALAESDHQAMVTAVAARFRRRHLLVLLTELSEEVLETSLLPALPILTRKHLVAVVSVRDPDVAAWATTRGDGLEHEFLRAAAIDQLATRDRLAAKLRARGVLVVDSDPEHYGAAVASLYLDAKAVGRL